MFIKVQFEGKTRKTKDTIESFQDLRGAGAPAVPQPGTVAIHVGEADEDLPPPPPEWLASFRGPTVRLLLHLMMMS